MDAGSARTDDVMTRAAASFLGQVLGLDEPPMDLANDLSPIKRDANAAIYTIQLESSVGPAAFLVYAYVLEVRGGDGRSGRESFGVGLETLQLAAQNDSPGPRAVAHAETDDFGFILATTPGTYRALVGETPRDLDLEARPSDFLPTREVLRLRSEHAGTLLRLLRETNGIASEWLSAIEGSGRPDADTSIAFTEHETELALFLLDDDSIGALLRSLNLLVATAQQQAASAIEDQEPQV